MKEEIEEIVKIAGKVDKGMVDTIMSKLEVMAAGLGTTAEYLWGIMIKQAYVTGVTNLSLIIMFVVLMGGYCKLLKSEWMQTEFADGNPASVLPLVFGGCGVVALIVILVVNLIPETATCLINPEYWAFETICNKIK